MLFTFAILIGVFAYIIFLIGLMGFLFPMLLTVLSLLFIACLLVLYRKVVWSSFRYLFVKRTPLFYAIFILLIIQAGINLIGALGPELSFDALWYHLTIPKIFMTHHEIFYIPGGLLYYSTMPKLAEMLYAAGLSFGSDTGPKLIHYFFGLLCCLAIYKCARKFYNPPQSLVAVAIFYSNLVVGWESITAYIDLIRTFFEILAVWAWSNWYTEKKLTALYLSAVLLGLAITTKLLSLESLGILVIMTIVVLIKNKKIDAKIIIRIAFFYCLIALSIPLPWFIFSFVTTHNPVYPFFSPYFNSLQHTITGTAHFSLITIIRTYISLFIHAADPISPVYAIFLPLLYFVWRKISKELQPFLWFSLLGFIGWYPFASIEGSRLILPYLATSALTIPAFIRLLDKMHIPHQILIQRIVYAITILSLVISIGYRTLANAKYIPVLTRRETRSQFLTNHLNFSFGDFYDTDGYFAHHITSHDRVLVIGMHNLYYIAFPFIADSWVAKNDSYDYIAIQHGVLPRITPQWKLVHIDYLTDVRVYALQDKQ